MIGQSDALQGHKHTDNGHKHIYSHVGGQGQQVLWTDQWSWNIIGDNTDTGYADLGLPTKYDDTYGEPRISTETRSVNLTYKIWKRIV